MLTLQQRMAEVLGDTSERGLQAAIARLCHKSRPTVSAWINDPDKVKTISRSDAELICAKWRQDISPAWLAEGTLPKFAPPGAQPGSSLSAIPVGKFRPVWVVGKGSGGSLPERIWTDGDHPVGVTGEYAEIASQDSHAFLGEVVGVSMVPRYNPGEFYLVEPGTDPDIEDDVLVRLADGQTLLKRLLSKRGGYRLGSYNSDDILFYKEDEVSWVYYVAHPVPRRRIKART